ncbi:hypothetical protein P8C59_007234 [Phyllachora maydis]|uniref:Uncharacterized protein n=1 Tax=Phyllachora maydis TaxID=1825666 RepID=A0AAD9I843_9PEZI|nr:hypothetical protein P8C59_007234 [Phyllachora maydis]
MRGLRDISFSNGARLGSPGTNFLHSPVRPNFTFANFCGLGGSPAKDSLGSSSNDHRRAQAPDFSTVMKFFVEMTTLVTDSAVERLYERNLEKAQEKTNAEYRKADEKHSDWPDVVQFQKHKNEDLLRQTTAAKKRREHAESLVRNKAESFCKDLIENLLLVDIQNRAQDNTLKDSDASSKDLNAILKDVGATRQGLDDLRKGLVDLRFTFASLKNTVQQNLDNAKQRGNMMQKEIFLEADALSWSERHGTAIDSYGPGLSTQTAKVRRFCAQ